jgi:hypothetical protein
MRSKADESKILPQICADERRLAKSQPRMNTITSE